MTETAELVLVPLPRAGAEVLHAAAHIGLEGADPQDVDVDAGEGAQQALRRALDTDPEAEVAVVRGGIQALESIFSHEKDFVLIDPEDGVGFIGGEDYSALYSLLMLLRDGRVEGERAEYALDISDSPNVGVARLGPVTATVRLDPDPDPDFADSHLQVTLLCDPPPRGYHREVYTGPIRLEGER